MKQSAPNEYKERLFFIRFSQWIDKTLNFASVILNDRGFDKVMLNSP